MGEAILLNPLSFRAHIFSRARALEALSGLPIARICLFRFLEAAGRKRPHTHAKIINARRISGTLRARGYSHRAAVVKGAVEPLRQRTVQLTARTQRVER